MIPIVEAEEDVYRFVSSDNGSAPMWCHGSTCLVRIGDHVFASGLETIEGLKTLNNYGAVHFCGVSDILEPYNEWRKYKRKITGKDWDYDFRRLFYTWTPDNRLLVVFYCGGKDAVGRPVSENRVLRICDSGAVDSPVRVPLQEPMTCFFTTTERGGSTRSDVLDLLGTPVESGRIRYARIRFSL